MITVHVCVRVCVRVCATYHLVLLPVVPARELLVAELADERTLAVVLAHVHCEVVTPGEGRVAHRAHERLVWIRYRAAVP